LHLRVESAVPCLGNRCFGGSAALEPPSE
jgi:hypothetical protein